MNEINSSELGYLLNCLVFECEKMDDNSFGSQHDEKISHRKVLCNYVIGLYTVISV